MVCSEVGMNTCGYRVAVSPMHTKRAEAVLWCYANVGPTDGYLGFSADYPWYLTGREIVFWDERDAVLFTLKWL